VVRGIRELHGFRGHGDDIRRRIAGPSGSIRRHAASSRWWADGGILATLRAGGTDGIIGRDTELVAVDEFLAGVRVGPGVLLLEGEAGAGKTTLWNVAVAGATQRGFRVLSCRAAATEAKLSFGGLDDLLGVIVAEVSDSLPEPQRQALDAVLLRGPNTGADARTVCRAVLETVRLLAGSGPVVVAVDDVQWLDRPTAQVLEYVVRRLSDEPVAMALAWRSAPSDALPLGLDRVPWPERVRRLPVRPLSVGALHQLVQSRLGLSLSRPILVRVHATSGGNPFYALEIARAVAVTKTRLAADEPLPIPATLTELVRSRLARLPAATRDVLLVVSALALPTRRLLAAVVGDARAGAAVDRAARVGVLVAEQDRLEFTHPLLASGVYADASHQRRIDVHRRLAELVADEEERARHLGLAAEDPDEDVAATLESAAMLARTRGAPTTAAEFYEQAGRLTPPSDGDGARRRLLAAARCHAEAGNTTRGRDLTEHVLSTNLAGPGRAEALLLLGGVEFGGLASEAIELLGQALGEAAGRPELEARVLVELVSVHLGRWNITAAAAHARVALAAAERAGDLGTLSRALVAAGRLEVFQGRPLGIQLVERAESMQPMVEHARIASLPSGWVGTLLRYMDDFDGARARLEPLLTRAGEIGDDSSSGELLYELSELECWTGNWERALRYAQQSVEIETLADRKWELTAALAALALVEAHLGRVEDSYAHATQGLAVARSMGGLNEATRNLRALAFLELSLSRPAPALAHLTEIAELVAAVEDPGVLRYAGDHIEALIGIADLEAAEQNLDRLERQSLAIDRAWGLAVAARCRGLLLNARGDVTGAVAAIDDALEHHQRVPMPFEHGRTLLVAGRTRRRAKRHHDARRALTAAQSIFDRLGAPLWAAKTTAELARIGGRSPAPQGLTSTEEQVVQLVIAGRSNPEVATELFMSRRTVEDHLSKIYRKLGVRSRTELAHRIASHTPVPPP
jgi:DNA-binding CsgD family transcriptional regulator